MIEYVKGKILREKTNKYSKVRKTKTAGIEASRLHYCKIFSDQGELHGEGDSRGKTWS